MYEGVGERFAIRAKILVKLIIVAAIQYNIWVATKNEIKLMLRKNAEISIKFM